MNTHRIVDQKIDTNITNKIEHIEPEIKNSLGFIILISKIMLNQIKLRLEITTIIYFYKLFYFGDSLFKLGLNGKERN